MGWRHADVDQCNVRTGQAHLVEQGLGVTCFGDHFDAGIVEQTDNAFPGEHDIVGDDYPHGNSARSRVGSMLRRPPRAPVRSAISRNVDVRLLPSSSTVIINHSPSGTRLTVT